MGLTSRTHSLTCTFPEEDENVLASVFPIGSWSKTISISEKKKSENNFWISGKKNCDEESDDHYDDDKQREARDAEIDNSNHTQLREKR